LTLNPVAGYDYSNSDIVFLHSGKHVDDAPAFKSSFS